MSLFKNEETDDLEHSPLENALFKISECSVESSSIEEYAAELHKIISKLLYAENFFVALYEQGKSLVNFVYVVDEFDKDVDEVLKHLTAEELRRTLTGYMLRTGRIQHLSAEDRQLLVDKNIVDSVGAESSDWLGVPLIYDNEILGGIVVQSYQDGIRYSKTDESILRFVARQIALFFKSKQSHQKLIDEYSLLEDRINERTRDLNRMNAALATEILEKKKSENIQSALFQISELVNTSRSLMDFYKNVHEVVARLMAADNFYIALLDDDESHVFFPYFVDQIDKKPVKRQVNLREKSKGLTERILTSGDALLYSESSDDPTQFIGAKCVSFLGVPLKNKTKTFGVLAIQSYQNDIVFDAKNREVLLTIGQQVATAILRKRDADSLQSAHETLEKRVKERTFELERTIEKRRLIEEKLEHESLHDALTGLPNRLHLSQTLNGLLKKTRSSATKMLALLFLDLDRFKVINDSLGHHVGDLFLQDVAERLKSCMRAGDLVARLGGDEFCILMPGIPEEKVALQTCTRILNELRKPVEVANHSLITSASIGVRLATTEEGSAELIMSDADAAMYQAKHQGKNRYCFFDAEIKKMVTSRMKMERDLRDAVENDELFLVYQPLIHLLTGRVVGFEALVRWNHPKSGPISPTEFIPVAEETGLIVDVGEIVVRKACEMLAKFSKNNELSKLYINVNVSSVQILARTLDNVIRDNINQYKVSPELLNVEITESILIEDYKTALSFVRELKSMGLKIYLDDFGTGYSSLSYLYKFPFDAIKLDRSFVIVINENARNQSIVESIAKLANNLGINIVAEGIENEGQLNVIKSLGYKVAQGYYFAKPLEESLLVDFVKDKNSKSAKS